MGQHGPRRPAWKPFTHYAPDVLLTDWAMPIFDGFEFTQMILRLREVTDDFLVQENRDRPDVFDQIRGPLVAPE